MSTVPRQLQIFFFCCVNEVGLAKVEIIFLQSENNPHQEMINISQLLLLYNRAFVFLVR